MEKYYFFYGSQVEEFERPKVPEIIAKKGIKAEIVGRKYNLNIKPSKTKVVVKNVHYKTK